MDLCLKEKSRYRFADSTKLETGAANKFLAQIYDVIEVSSIDLFLCCSSRCDSPYQRHAIRKTKHLLWRKFKG